MDEAYGKLTQASIKMWASKKKEYPFRNFSRLEFIHVSIAVCKCGV
jgi:hypothetical protein